MRIRLQDVLVCLLALALVAGCGGEESPDGGSGGAATAGSGGSGAGGAGGGAARDLGTIHSQFLMASVSGPRQNVPTDLGGLVPTDAVAVLHVGAPADLVKSAQRVAAAIDESVAEQVDMQWLLSMLARGIPGLTPDQIDAGRAMAMAVTLSSEEEGSEPRPTIILPLRDVAQARADIELAIEKSPFKPEGGSPAKFGASYVAFTQGHVAAAESTGETPAIAKDLPAGGISLRVDVATLVERYGSMARAMLGSGLDEASRQVPPGQEGVTELMGSLKDGFEKLLNSAEMLELGLGIEGTEMSFIARLSMKPGSPLAEMELGGGDLTDLAARLPAGAPIAVMGNLPFERLLEWMEPLMQAGLASMPEEGREAAMTQWRKAMTMYQHLDGRVAAAMSFGEEGMSGLALYGAKNPEAFLAAMEGMFEGGWADLMAQMGITMSRVEGGDASVRRYRMSMDFGKLAAASGGGAMPPEQREMMNAMSERLLGPGGLAMAMAGKGDRVVATFGSEPGLLERGLADAAPGAVAPAYARAMALGGDAPCFVLHLDARAYMRQIIEIVKHTVPPDQREMVPEIPAGPPIPFDIAFGTEGGRTARFGLRVEVGEIGRLVGMFLGQARNAAPPPRGR